MMTRLEIMTRLAEMVSEISSMQAQAQAIKDQIHELMADCAMEEGDQ